MSSETHHVIRIADVEAVDRRRLRPQFRSPSACLSDSDDEQSWDSPLHCVAEGDKFSGIEGVSVSDPHSRSRSRSESSFSDCLSDLDLEKGVTGTPAKAPLVEAERDCRICKLSLEGATHESGVSIHLGCCCKGDLGNAHTRCAQTWFQIRGNTNCEICGATAANVAGEHITEAHNASTASTVTPAELASIAEAQCFWRGRRIMNIVLACMVLAFIISWLFHSHAFKKPSHLYW